MKCHWIMKNLISLLIIVLFTACGSNSGSDGSAESSEEVMEMLESVFEGPYSRWAIKDKMDTVLTAYNIELKKENYLKIGNQLVAARKESGVLEVSIINELLEAKAKAGGLSFDDQLRRTTQDLQQNLVNRE